MMRGGRRTSPGGGWCGRRTLPNGCGCRRCHRRGFGPGCGGGGSGRSGSGSGRSRRRGAAGGVHGTGLGCCCCRDLATLNCGRNGRGRAGLSRRHRCGRLPGVTWLGINLVSHGVWRGLSRFDGSSRRWRSGAGCGGGRGGGGWLRRVVGKRCLRGRFRKGKLAGRQMFALGNLAQKCRIGGRSGARNHHNTADRGCDHQFSAGWHAATL